MKKKTKKKNKRTLSKSKKSKTSKSKKNKTSKLISKKRRSKIKKKNKKFKRRKRNKLKKSKRKKIIQKQRVKIPKFKKQKKYKIKLSFQKAINFLLRPIFEAYDDFREKRRIKKLRNIALEKKEREEQIKAEQRLRYEAKQKEIRDEIKLAKERAHDLKKFIRHEQAILRNEQAEKRRRFLEEIKLEKKVQAFRVREQKELQHLEKWALKEQVKDYRADVEERIEKIKEKYRLIREQKIRERVQSLGVEISDVDTKEDLLKKEKEYAEHRHTIELVLESFYRSANSLVFQLNKRYIPKHKSILRVIDRRYESNECFIRYDDSPDEDWLILIYLSLEDSNAQKGKIVVENKANPEKHETKSFDTKEIFIYSDYLVDVMTAHIDRERQRKSSDN